LLAGAAAALIVTLAVASPARAQEPAAGGFAPGAGGGGAAFGTPGQWVLTMGFAKGEYAFFHKQGGGGWQIGIQPSADYFIIRNLSVGGVLGFEYDSGGAYDVQVGGRAGYSLPVSGPWVFWPMAGITVDVNHANYATNTNAAVVIFAPFLFHIIPHLFVGVGPSFALSLNNAGNNYGVDSILGGYF
jgi:hypothetical protein